MSGFERRIVVTGGPWIERIGCHGIVLNDPGDGVYPFDRPAERTEWKVILLDDDPCRPTLNRAKWSCVVNARYLETEAP